MSDELTARPGYRVIALPKGPQKGQRLLRIAWPEQPELRALQRLAQQADSDETADDNPGPTTMALYKMMADFIPEWTLCDRMGQPLPQPKDDPGAFDKLDPFTLRWFVPSDKDNLWSDILPNVR